jgi:hypothetical protein
LDLEDNLFKHSEEEYGNHYRAHFLEIYKLYVEMADRISARRQMANSFFLTINGAILAVFGSPQFGISLANLGPEQSNDFSWIISLLGMIFCVVWLRLIHSYKALNTAKFQVILGLEQRLAVAPYETEWKVLEKGENRKRHKPFTHIEMIVPWVFFVLNLALLLKVSLG